MEPNRNDSYMGRISSSLLRSAILVVAVSLLGLAVWPAARTWFSSGRNVYYKNAMPRLVTARGDLAQDEQNAIGVYRTVAPSVVFVTSVQVQKNRSLFRFSAMQVEKDAGSGFVWDPNGYIVTNYHVVENSEVVEVTLCDQSVRQALRVGTDPDKDIAVIKIDAPRELLPPIAIGTSRDLMVGQRVYAIGNPFGYDQTLTSGIISGLGREITGASNRPIQGVIQTDAPINPGNSGGPLLDSAGRVVGMNTAILSPTGAYAGIGFAVPIDAINRIVPEIIRGEAVPRPSLGIKPAEDHIVRRLGLEGVLILTIAPNTSAEKAGLHETERNESGRIVLGDLITAIDGEPVRTTDDLYRIIDRHKVGDTVKMTITREGKQLEVQVKLEPLP
jgi:S1-C subfamily serine protease